MIKYIVWLIILVLTIGLVSAITIIKSSTKSNQNYIIDMVDFADSCSLNPNINISNPVCSSGLTLSFIFYNDSSWNGFCCDFDNSKCDNRLYSTYNETIGNYDTYVGYSVYANNNWINVCCDIDGKNCYIDVDNTQVCDVEFNIPIFNIEFQNPNWNITSCRAGVY